MLARKLKRLLLLALAGALFSTVALAQAVRSDRPDVYVVKRGDTLWDISARFLNEPWLWPEIWEANPQIHNPHLIFPGDEISLVYVDGRPRLHVRRGPRPVVKASPRVRVSRRGRRPIPTIPIDAIAQFLARPRVVDEGSLERAPYVLSVGKEHLVAGSGFRIYARGKGLNDARRYAVFRQGAEYVDPDTGDVLGREAKHLGDAVLERTGDPATLRLIRTEREVLAGDRLLPVDEERFNQNFLPVPPPRPVAGSVIEVVDGVTQIGQYQIVVLNIGHRAGLEIGHVLAVWQKGGKVIDEYRSGERLENTRLPKSEPVIETDPKRQGGIDGFSMAADGVVRAIQRSIGSAFRLPRKVEVDLPEERAGTVLVFRVFDRISYALVMAATRAMHIRDSVRNP